MKLLKRSTKRIKERIRLLQQQIRQAQINTSQLQQQLRQLEISIISRQGGVLELKELLKPLTENNNNKDSDKSSGEKQNGPAERKPIGSN